MLSRHKLAKIETPRNGLENGGADVTVLFSKQPFLF